MKRQFRKGDAIIIFKDGQQTGQTTNLDQDRQLGVGDVFDWHLFTKMQPTTMKVLSLQFPLMVEVMD